MKTHESSLAMTPAFAPKPIPSPATIADVEAALIDYPEVASFLRNMDILPILLELPHALATGLDVAYKIVSERRQKMVNLIYEELPKQFIDSLPDTMGGFTKSEAGYWLEPERKPLREDAVVHRFVINNGYARRSMAPRFLPGAVIEMEEIFSGDPLNIGEVYYAGHGDFFRLHNLMEGANGGTRMDFSYDADQWPENAPANYSASCHGLNFHNEEFRLFRFVRYDSYQQFEGLDTNPTPLEFTDWASVIKRYAECERKRLAANARRRELRAIKKQRAGAIRPTSMPMAFYCPQRSNQDRRERVAA